MKNGDGSKSFKIGSLNPQNPANPDPPPPPGGGGLSEAYFEAFLEQRETWSSCSHGEQSI